MCSFYPVPPLYRLNRCEDRDTNAITHFKDLVENDEPEEEEEEENPEPEMLPESNGLTLNIRYSELWDTDLTEDNVIDQSSQSLFAGDGFGESEQEQYLLQSLWPVYDRDQYVGNWSETDTPVLILNGALDPLTPAQNVQAFVEGLTFAQTRAVVLPFAGHETLGSTPTREGVDCGTDIAVQFLQNSLANLDSSCTDDIPPINFNGNTEDALEYLGTESFWD